MIVKFNQKKKYSKKMKSLRKKIKRGIEVKPSKWDN